MLHSLNACTAMESQGHEHTRERLPHGNAGTHLVGLLLHLVGESRPCQLLLPCLLHHHGRLLPGGTAAHYNHRDESSREQPRSDDERSDPMHAGRTAPLQLGEERAVCGEEC